jgi:hypothetical protein
MREVKRAIALLKISDRIQMARRYGNSQTYTFNFSPLKEDKVKVPCGHLDSKVKVPGLKVKVLNMKSESAKGESESAKDFWFAEQNQQVRSVTNEDNTQRRTDKDYNSVRKNDDDEDEDDLEVFRRFYSKNENPNTNKREPAASNDFDMFWDAYPPYNKTNKEATRKEFLNAIRKVDVQTIISKAKRYADEVAEHPDTFPWYPMVWLRDGHWNDQYKPTALDLLAASQERDREREAREAQRASERQAEEIQAQQCYTEGQAQQCYTEGDEPAEDDTVEEQPVTTRRGPFRAIRPWLEH